MDESIQEGIDLDLNALAPKKVNILYEDKTIGVAPFDMETFARFYALSSEMSSIAAIPAEEQAAKVMDLYGKMDAFIKAAIPDFSGIALNQAQLIAIFRTLGKLNMPTDKVVAELQKHDITVKGGDQGDPKGLTS